jgi:HPt (histidine-containing phosphotransfer) domain-containing protein
MNDYISKPINPEEFLDKLNQWVQVQSNFTWIQPKTVGEMDETLPLDMEGALPRFANNKKLFFDLLQEFFRQLDTKIPEIEAAYDKKDAKALFQLGHYLKGMSGNFNSKRLVNLTATLEAECKAEHLEEVPTLIQKIRDESARIRWYYEQLLE